LQALNREVAKRNPGQCLVGLDRPSGSPPPDFAGSLVFAQEKRCAGRESAAFTGVVTMTIAPAPLRAPSRVRA